MIFDNSQLQAYKDCPEKYRLRYIENLQKRVTGEEDHHKNFGQGIHAALEVYYKHRQSKTLLLKKEYHQAFLNIYPVSLKEEDLAKSPEGGTALLDAYINHYARQDEDMEVLAVEVTDTFPIGIDPSTDEEVMFTIKLDAVVKKQGCIYALEHKTTGKSFGYGYWNQFDPNSQMTAQTAYVKWKYGECSGVIVNAMRFGYAEKNVLLDYEDIKYSNREFKYNKYHKKDMWHHTGFFQEFQRNVINRDAQQVEAWKLDQMDWILSIRQDKTFSREKQSWRKNEGNCVYCNYREVCISVNDAQIIEQLYELKDQQGYLKGGETELKA